MTKVEASLTLNALTAVEDGADIPLDGVVVDELVVDEIPVARRRNVKSKGGCDSQSLV